MVGCQTDLTADGMRKNDEALDKMQSDARQTQKDIKVLLQSYDNFKEESAKQKSELR